MDIFLIAAESSCGGLEPIIRVIKGLFQLIQIVVPIALLIFGVIDLAKAVLASDEKEIKAAQGKLIKRSIAAAAVFFAVTLVNVIMGLVAKGGDEDTSKATDWIHCWDNV